MLIIATNKYKNKKKKIHSFNLIKLKISDRYFLLPDYIRRHKMVVRKYENKTILLVIGGDKSFRSSE